VLGFVAPWAGSALGWSAYRRLWAPKDHPPGPFRESMRIQEALLASLQGEGEDGMGLKGGEVREGCGSQGVNGRGSPGGKSAKGRPSSDPETAREGSRRVAVEEP
jgi:hypothetical protein